MRPAWLTVLTIVLAVGTMAPASDPMMGASTAPAPEATPVLPAFPGAQGWGAASQGGRGGRVIKVTNLATHGPGSL